MSINVAPDIPPDYFKKDPYSDVSEQERGYWELFMREALSEAKKALEMGRYGIGAVLVLKDEIIARSMAQVQHSPLMTHQETRVLEIAACSQKWWRPENRRKMTVVSTAEPCPMCWGIILLWGIGKVVFGLEDPPTRGIAAKKEVPPLFRVQAPIIIGGILREESAELLFSTRTKLDTKYLTESLDSQDKAEQVLSVLQKDFPQYFPTQPKSR